MKKAIVNLATAPGKGRNEWYRLGQERLRNSLKGRFDGDFFAFGSEAEVGAGNWQQFGGQIKPFAIEIIRDKGYPLVLWMDSSLFAIAPLAPIFDKMEKDGYFLMYNGGLIAGEWCSDAALVTLGVSRDELMKVREINAASVGFNFEHPDGKALFDEWARLARDGITFAGAYTNENCQVSTDRRVKGHRQDQSALSALCHKMKLKPVEWLKTLDHIIGYRYGG